MRWSLARADSSDPLTRGGTNTYIVHGAAPVLVDAASAGAAYLDLVHERLDGARLGTLLATHAHLDHMAGAAAVLGRWPDASAAKVPWPDRDAAAGVAWSPLADKQFLPAGDGHLLVLHTPGHAPDHACFLDVRSGTLFGGDLLMNGGTVTIPASNGGSLRQYLQSLRRLLRLQPRTILPGHGDVIRQPAPLIRGYLAHRQMREDQIVEALADEARTVDEIAERLYRGLEEGLLGAARENVLAHLVMLEEDGRVSRRGEAWRVV